MEDKATSHSPAAVPDYTLPAFEKAAGIQRTGGIDGARAAWIEFIRNYPHSPRIAEAKTALGGINTSQVLSPVPSSDKTSYAVSRGDSLVKIASKFKSNAELIFRVNHLQTINLQIGQQLVIPQLDISIVVDRKAGTITLLNRGQFFKEYPHRRLEDPGGFDFRSDQGGGESRLAWFKSCSIRGQELFWQRAVGHARLLRPRHQRPSRRRRGHSASRNHCRPAGHRGNFSARLPRNSRHH